MYLEGWKKHKKGKEKGNEEGMKKGKEEGRIANNHHRAIFREGHRNSLLIITLGDS